MKRRADEMPEGQPTQELAETGAPPAEEQPQKKRPKYSVTLYVTIMFVVVILLILLSYFIQQRNSKTIQDLTTQHSEFSIEALQNIENLQNQNIELMERVEELEKELSDVREDWAEDVKQVEDQLKEDYNTILLQYKAMCDLVDLEMALEDGNKTLAKEKANAIEAVKDLLSQEYLERYEALAKKI